MTINRHVRDIVDGYVEAMLWAETDDDGNPLDDSYDIEDIAPETLERIRGICSAFYDRVKSLDYSCLYAREHSDEECLGHDLWLTSRGHGVGFWEPGRWTIDGEETGIDNPLCQAAYDVHDPENKYPAARGCSDGPYIGDDGLIFLP